MTSFSNDDLIAEGDAQGARLATDLTDLFAAPVPSLTFQRPAAPGRLERPRWLGIRTAAIAMGAVAVAVAIAVAATLLAFRPWSGTTEVNAAEILVRTAAVAAGRTQPEPSHTIYSAETPSSVGKHVFRTEIWYDGTDQYRIEVRSWFEQPYGTSSPLDPNDSLHGRVIRGDDAWIYHQQSVCPGEIIDPRNCDGVLRAVRLPSSELDGFPLDFTDQPANLPDLLASYGTDTCPGAELHSERIFAGRLVFVILIAPDAGCPQYEEGLIDIPVDIRDDEGRVIITIPFTKVNKVLVWVDQETFFQLQTTHERNDSTVVSHGMRYEKDPELPDSMFTYEPPEGVTVQEVANYEEAREAIGPPEQ